MISQTYFVASPVFNFFTNNMFQELLNNFFGDVLSYCKEQLVVDLLIDGCCASAFQHCARKH